MPFQGALKHIIINRVPTRCNLLQQLIFEVVFSLTAHLEVPSFGRAAEATTLENTLLKSQWHSKELLLKVQAEQTSSKVWHYFLALTLLGQGEEAAENINPGKKERRSRGAHRVQAGFLVVCNFLPLDTQRKALLFSLHCHQCLASFCMK